MPAIYSDQINEALEGIANVQDRLDLLRKVDSSTLDAEVKAELAAMQKLVEALTPLDAPTRGRVLRWALERFLGEPRGGGEHR